MSSCYIYPVLVGSAELAPCACVFRLCRGVTDKLMINRNRSLIV